MDYDAFRTSYHTEQLPDTAESNPHPTPEAWRERFDTVLYTALQPDITDQQKELVDTNVREYLDWITEYYPEDLIESHHNQREAILDGSFDARAFWQNHYHILNLVTGTEVTRYIDTNVPQFNRAMMTIREAYLSSFGAQHFNTFMCLREISNTLKYEQEMGKNSNHAEEAQATIRSIDEALPKIAGAANEIDFCLGMTKYQLRNQKWHIFVASPFYEAKADDHNADFFLAKHSKNGVPADIIPIQIKTTHYLPKKYSKDIQVISMRRDFGNELGVKPHHYTSNRQSMSAPGLYSALNLKHAIRHKEISGAHRTIGDRVSLDFLQTLARTRSANAPLIANCKDYSKKVHVFFSTMLES